MSMVRLRSKSCLPDSPTVGEGWREAETVLVADTFPAGECGVKDQVSWGATRNRNIYAHFQHRLRRTAESSEPSFVAYATNTRTIHKALFLNTSPIIQRRTPCR
jgi:hypothetical protein